jgi:hypothetical protein
MVCLYLALAALPATAMMRSWKDHRLDGALQPQPRPALAFAAVRSEDYQSKFTAWFELALGLRNWSIWIDNTLFYHAFGETKWGSHVAVGRDGILFERDDIGYFNKAGVEVPGPGAFDKLADRIASLQRRLQRQHRALVPVFVPSKTTLFADKVPALWTRDLGTPRPSTEGVYLAMKRALDARHVVYVDGIELLTHATESRDLLWGPDARHFSLYAGCLCNQETVRRYAELTHTPAFAYPCQADVKRAHREHRDLDLFRLVNAWGARRDPIARDSKHEPTPAAPLADAPRVMWIASSFGWTLMNDAEQSLRFRQLHLDYYGGQVYEAGTGASFDSNRHDDQWRAIFPTRELYVFELFESYLLPDYYGGSALDALDAELGAEPPAPPSPAPP